MEERINKFIFSFTLILGNEYKFFVVEQKRREKRDENLIFGGPHKCGGVKRGGMMILLSLKVNFRLRLVEERHQVFIIACGTAMRRPGKGIINSAKRLIHDKLR